MAENKSKEKQVPSVDGVVPPHDIELEKEILGAILIDPEAIGKALEIMKDSKVFYLESHRKIFEAMKNLYSKSEPVDLKTVSAELQKQKDLEKVGGPGYIANLSTTVPSSANLDLHLSILRDLYLLRETIYICTDISRIAYQREKDSEELLDYAEHRFFQISQESISKGYQRVNPIIHEVMGEIEALHERKTEIEGVTGVPSGFKELDKITTGFHETDLVILAGRPGMGKTALALNIARNVAVRYNKPAAFFSLEMGAKQLVLRLISAESGVPLQKIRTGKLSEDEFLQIARNIGHLSQAPLYIDDTPGLNILTLRSRARRLKAEADIQLLLIDYLQLMEGPRTESRQIEITMISRALKNLAKELDIPVIALSQLSRAVEARTDKKPLLSDLRESGAIEQDADLVMFVYRPEYYKMEYFPDNKEIDTHNKMQILIEKHRNGPTGSCIVHFGKEVGRIYDLDMVHRNG
ncbi:MAG: replicative DNA helicase [Calditrichia bacterium]